MTQTLNEMELVTKQMRIASKYFRSNPKYIEKVSLAETYYREGRLEECGATLEELPTESQLLDELIEKLKGKSVHKTLKKIAAGKESSSWEEMKGWFSLGTHVVIEVEQGGVEYGLLLEKIYERLGVLVYETR